MAPRIIATLKSLLWALMLLALIIYVFAILPLCLRFEDVEAVVFLILHGHHTVRVNLQVFGL